MEKAENNHAATVEWSVEPGIPPTLGEVVAIVMGVAVTPRRKVDIVAYSASSASDPLDVAETLAYENRDVAKWYRRILRKQGRIDRLIRSASCNLLTFLNGIPNASGKDALKGAATELDAVERLMRNERGPSLLRRLCRPQPDINEHLSRAVSIISQWVLDPARGFVPAGEDGARLAEAIRWHANEAEYLSLRRKHRRTIVRRYMCDQYQINRCAIIAIRKMVELFIKG